MQSYIISDAEAERLLPVDHLKLHIEGVEVSKAQYLERMAAAFMVQTGTPAAECELVQQALERPQYGWRFFYRRLNA